MAGNGRERERERERLRLRGRRPCGADGIGCGMSSPPVCGRPWRMKRPLAHAHPLALAHEFPYRLR
ncbi:MAG TPA: hypothetical protein VF188_17705 [Longimicrobiales bacterium]